MFIRKHRHPVVSDSSDAESRPVVSPEAGGAEVLGGAARLREALQADESLARRLCGGRSGCVGTIARSVMIPWFSPSGNWSAPGWPMPT